SGCRGAPVSANPVFGQRIDQSAFEQANPVFYADSELLDRYDRIEHDLTGPVIRGSPSPVGACDRDSAGGQLGLARHDVAGRRVAPERKRWRMKHDDERIGNLTRHAARVKLELTAKRFVIRNDAPVLDAKRSRLDGGRLVRRCVD